MANHAINPTPNNVGANCQTHGGAGYFFVRGTPPARRERGELSFAPAPVLQAAESGLSNRRWSLLGLTPSATVRRLPALGRLGSARPVSALKLFAFLRHIHVKYSIKKDMIKTLIKEMRV